MKAGFNITHKHSYTSMYHNQLTAIAIILSKTLIGETLNIITIE